ncbi:OmpP1/FadL family transporter [Paludibacterium yongneupense]|uniref:OmpP1/FadL family transporter n=1 Tax=Paludibacterium yongneupense TaxID=400061 RepID=UPI000403682E|nr:OmpP1/FadL family transporter [Paludibacterium yongneupense]
MKLKHISLSVMTIGGALGVCGAPAALASGYNFGSQSVSAQGTAHANAAEAADASTLYYNPAGMTFLDGDQITVGSTLVIPSSSFTNNGSTTVVGTTTSGGNGGSFAPSAVVAPNLYYSHQIDDKIHVGLGIFVPYGAKLNYGTTWAGRYALESVNLQTINFNPSISYKLDEHHSFGFGVSAQYMKADLTKAVDVKSGLILAGSGLASFITGDGQVDMSASGWGFGYNLGYMYSLDEHTRFGLSYRSKVIQRLDGNATWDYSNVSSSAAVVAGVKAAATHKTSNASLTVETPESASASFYHDLNSKWAVMADVTWTGHSDMNTIDVRFPGTSEGDMTVDQKWKNTFMFALGANYKYNDKLLLRSGVAYEQSPVPSDSLRHPALPDSDRYWLSFGANYKFTRQSSIDVAYSYVFFKNATVNYSDNCTPVSSNCTGNGETTRGSYKTHLQLVGLAYNYRF